MGRNSVVTKTGSTYKITQGTAEFSDYRRWYLNTSGKALAITDDFKIARVGADGIVEDTSDALITNDTAHITLCLNRDESIVYSITRWVGFSVTLRWFRVSDMVDIGSQSLSVPDIDPLRAIISADERIVWLGDNKTLYRMDLDGGNLESQVIPFTNVDSFSLTTNGEVAVFGYNSSSGWSRVRVITISDMTYEEYNIQGHTSSYRTVDMFYLDGATYMMLHYYLATVSRIEIMKIIHSELVDGYDPLLINLYDSYGIENRTTAQFNASGADNYATFSCTIGTRQAVMQCNLDTLECMPARRVNYAEREIEYSTGNGSEEVKSYLCNLLALC